ncbi:MAG: sensor histidine kinase, partial [Pyrinomonadaceae bacterium]
AGVYMDDARAGREPEQTSSGLDGSGSAATDSLTSAERVESLISELRQRTSELEQANRELRRVSHYRSLFLARISHELRTPLTSILGFTEILLEQEELTETQRRFCQKVQDSGFQLQASLNQLVDLSRLEAGQMEAFLQEFSLRETLRDSAAAVARLAQKRQVRLEYQVAPEITTMVSDPGKLRQALFNFISWAVSRSDMGQAVKISVTVEPDKIVYIQILDDGEKLKDESHIFDPEEISDSAEANINELGIIIGRRLLELIEGKVQLLSGDTRGLTVTLSVPLRPAKAQA